jgi:hypothetical protein
MPEKIIDQQHVFGIGSKDRIDLGDGDDVEWTADGQFVIINSGEKRGCLLRLTPWEVIPIGERFDAVMKNTEHGQLHTRLHKDLLPGIGALPVAGWLTTWLAFSEYAINYEKNEVVELIRHDIAPPPRAVLVNDGSRVLMLSRSGRVTVVPIDLSNAPVVGRW